MNLNKPDAYFDRENRYLINVDFDGTLTNGENGWITEPTPNIEHIRIINKLYRKGFIIIIHTARTWDAAPKTVAWLIRNNVPYHGLFMFKGGSDSYYCDDKNITWEELKLLSDK